MINQNKVKKIISENRRVLVGLAHADKGEKQEGCNCCFCAPVDAKVKP